MHEPLNPQRLVTILAHLLPPAYPLAPDLLASAVKTRQLYLPPNPSNPNDDRFIAQRPRTQGESEGGDPEDLSSRLRAIADSKTHERDPEFSNEVQLQGEGNDIEVALYRESWNVRYRALDEQTLIAKLDLVPHPGDEEQGVRILFFPEQRSSDGDDDNPDDSARIQPVDAEIGSASVSYRTQLSMGDEWKLFDVKPLEEARAEEQQTSSSTSSKDVLWSTSPREAFDAITRGKQGQGNGEVGGEDQPDDDDYWGGYSDSEQEAQQGSQPPPSATTEQKPASAGGKIPQENMHSTGLPAPVPGSSSGLPAQSYTNPLSATSQSTLAAPSIADVSPSPSHSPADLSLGSNVPGNATLPPSVLVKKVTISPFVSRFTTPVGGLGSAGDDAYWSSYGGVEDGLKVSNPPSPRGVSRLSTPAGGYWGTGGESPVSWSPPANANQALPATSSGQAASPQQTADNVVQGKDATPSAVVDTQTRLQQAAQSAQLRTNAVFANHEGHLDLSSPALDFAPESPVIEPAATSGPATTTAQERQAVLRVTIAGLRSMYLGAAAAGSDQGTLAREFAQVLGEFM
ncbi:hypothetical protein QFC19_004947 [Naganishia cerealis]|uniref:Uncharacterized protein n=1 Tax=Naganishia cerealis TaxID=610337 RepID=A0ACC2VSB1_9TREE|nr:hypothetical protein QFC19_004947 [Naganishia cerealis]